MPDAPQMLNSSSIQFNLQLMFARPWAWPARARAGAVHRPLQSEWSCQYFGVQRVSFWIHMKPGPLCSVLLAVESFKP